VLFCRAVFLGANLPDTNLPGANCLANVPSGAKLRQTSRLLMIVAKIGADCAKPLQRLTETLLVKSSKLLASKAYSNLAPYLGTIETTYFLMIAYIRIGLVRRKILGILKPLCIP
jgi:hypothetical protein